MFFRVLGRLEVTENGAVVPWNGVARTATLGMLALHHNSVVPVESVEAALWPQERPATSRKMVLNALSAVRTLLAADPGAQLVRHRNGYEMVVDPWAVDAERFRAMAREGRQAVAGADFANAADTFRRALELWRGPVLADLGGMGLEWPEMEFLRSTRQVVVQDCMRAELAADRPAREVDDYLSEVHADPYSEGLRAMTMLALYRAGRRPEALELYRTGRETLVDELGLDPGPELRRMEAAILDDSPWLWSLAATGLSGSLTAVPAQQATSARRDPATGPTEMRRWVSVLAVRPDLDPEVDVDPEDLGEMARALTESLRICVERLGGVVQQPAGATVLAVFGVPRARGDDAARAVRAALDVQTELRAADSSGPRALRLTVTSGEALVADPHGRTVTGQVIERGIRLLDVASPDVVRLCELTRAAIPERPGLSRPAPALEPGALPTVPLIGRERELTLLEAALARVEREGGPTTVTVVGEPGVGRSRVLTDFTESVAARSGAGRTVVASATVRPLDWRSPSALLAEHIAQLARSTGRADVPDVDRLAALPPGLAAPAWVRAVREAASAFPVLLAVDDAHLADAELREVLDSAPERLSGLPVMLLRSARVGSADERPRRVRCASTVVLEQFDEQTTERLLLALADAYDLRGTGSGREAMHGLDRAVSTGYFGSLVGGNPLFAVELFRMLAGIHEPSRWPPLHTVAVQSAGPEGPPCGLTRMSAVSYSTISAWLDTLPLPARTFVHDAAVYGDALTSRSAQMLGSEGDATGLLDLLVERGLFASTETAGEREYRFRHAVVLDVAYAQIIRASRAEKHRLSADAVGSGAQDGALRIAHHLTRAEGLEGRVPAEDCQEARTAGVG